MAEITSIRKVSDKEAKKVWKELDRKICSITLHFEGGASMQMSIKAFRKMTLLDRK